MSDQQVRFVYEVTSQEAVRAVEELATAMEQQAATSEGASQSTEQLQNSVENLREQTDELRDSAEQNARSHQSLVQQFDAAGRGAQSLAQRVQGTASAIQALVSATGSDDRTAGAIASMAGLTAQGAALGATLGPGGAALGAVVGFTSSILSMADAQDTAAEAAANHRRELEQLAALNISERDREAFRREVETGLISRNRSDSMLEREREVARLELAELDTREAANDARRLEAERALGGTGRELSENMERVLTNEANAVNTLRDSRNDMIVVIDAEIAARRQLASMTDRHNREDRDPPRTGGGRGPRGRTIDDLTGGAANNADLAAIGAEAEARAAERAGEEKERQAQEFEANEAKRIAALNLERELLHAEDERRHQRRLEMTRREAEASRRADEERRRRLENEQRILSDFGNAVGSVFGQAFGAAIQGQESFDVALLKGTKQALIQYGTSMVAEGTGALLTAAGNVILNPPAAASKAIEGAGKIALGVGLGAAGAAIQPPTAGDTGGRAERPQNQTPSSGPGDGSYHVVVNMNAPAVVGGTFAEFGRLVGRGQRAAAQRFGRAA